MTKINLPKGIRTETVVHRKEKRIKLLFEYNAELIEQVKTIQGSR